MIRRKAHRAIAELAAQSMERRRAHLTTGRRRCVAAITITIAIAIAITIAIAAVGTKFDHDDDG